MHAFDKYPEQLPQRTNQLGQRNCTQQAACLLMLYLLNYSLSPQMTAAAA
jgi:hypothetical protein